MLVESRDQADELREAVRRLGLTRPASSDHAEAAGVTHFRAPRPPPGAAPPRAGEIAAPRTAAAAMPESVSTHLPPSRTVPPIIAVASGKGGVGKTHLAAGLALALADAGTSIVLLDADAGTPNADVVLGVEPRHDLAEFLAGRCAREPYLVPVAPRMRFAPGASSDVMGSELALARTHRIRGVAAELSDPGDVLVLDCGAGIGSTVRGPALAADLLLVVCTPEPTAITDAYALIKTIHFARATRSSGVEYSNAGPAYRSAPVGPGSQSNGVGPASQPNPVGPAFQTSGVRPAFQTVTPRMGLIVNRAASEREGLAVAERLRSVVARFLGAELPHLGTIREDSHVPAALQKRRPCQLLYPRCRASREIATIAASIRNSLNSRAQAT